MPNFLKKKKSKTKKKKKDMNINENRWELEKLYSSWEPGIWATIM